MSSWILFLIGTFCLLNSSVLISQVIAHEGHHDVSPYQEKVLGNVRENAGHHSLEHWIHWIGNFHLIFVHFPIALVIMTGVSELLFYKKKNPLFEQASRFMLYAAAILAIPTALLGLALGYDADYSGVLATFYFWHRFIGIAIPFWAFLTIYYREKQKSISYVICLIVLITLVSIEGFLGGGMAFGPDHLPPPFFDLF